MALKEVRTVAGLSQSQLSELSGVNYRTLQKYEIGAKDINGAKLATLLKLCKALNCGLSDIVTDEETLQLLDELNY